MTYAVCVTFTIIPEQMERFSQLVEEQAKNSIDLEPDCFQFDVCRDETNPNCVFLYEIYKDKPAFELHLKSKHFLEFDAAVAEMVSDKKVLTWQNVFRP